MTEDIVHVVLRHVPLRAAGCNFIAHCPFHKERGKSFCVNPHQQIWYCFGCHAGGDTAAFVKAWESKKAGQEIPRDFRDKCQLLVELDMANKRIKDLESELKHH